MLTDSPDRDYSPLDRPEILMGLFHPRPEYGATGNNENAVEVLIEVEKGIVVGGRFHMGAERGAPNILFFHGNGEIVADYDELGPLYNTMGMNFLPVDYRGYGRSTGTPTVTAMMRDCHAVLHFAREWLRNNGFTGPFVVMGRSLGSASALELANRHKKVINGLILESGFAHTGPLLELLGIDLSAIGFREEQGARNLEKIKTWDKPTLIIHAEFDHLIPFSDAQALYDACPSSDKTLLKIPGANHNDIFMKGLDMYMEAVKTLCEKARKGRR
ncbi:MAG: alpha/beta hydrolase [Deltaproteobacteria bacterium]|nr:alpha/beta hydrolase [Deltaproteobacteria bacterium]